MDRPPPPPPGSGHGHGPGHGSDEDRCKLLGTTGLVVQALMGVFVILSLVVKRQLERQKRSWRIWMYDVSKQLAGQAVVHGLNVLISDLVASAAHNNPCSLYFLNVLIDTTIGVGIIYFSLKAFTWYFSRYLELEGFISGQYGHPPRPDYWWKQLAPYLLSIITMKLLVILPLTLPGISKFLIDASHSMLDYLSPQAQIIFVMAIFPVIMNVFQFCLVDQLIKGGKDIDEDEGEGGSSGPGRGRGRGAGARGGGYSRVPEWEGNVDAHDHHHDHDHAAGNDDFGDGDLESGRRRQSRKENIKEITQTHTGTRRERSQSRNRMTTARSTSMTTPVLPSSPLLSPGDGRGYGSTTPSPIGSPDKPSFQGLGRVSGGGNGVGAGKGKEENIWTKIMSKLSDSSASASASASNSNSEYASAIASREHSVIFDSTSAIAHAGAKEDSRSSSSHRHSHSHSHDADRLDVRNERGTRSAAPSPDSIRPVASSSLSPSPISPSMFPHHSQSKSRQPAEADGSDEFAVSNDDDGGQEDSRAGYDVASGLEGLSRHLPEGLEREARWTLSPPESPTVSDGRDKGTVGDSVGLTEVHTRPRVG
ncbi:hypothetical protein I317_07642 [Kwoniella heveanensis CBS 569]|nr:hypothetical protein I317_07642 [Kwoniella heveanensis CBS 569]